MINLYELDEITLLPSATNNGHLGADINYLQTDELDLTGYSKTLPIFTLPSPSIVGKSSVKSYSDAGIRSILPSTEDINTRLEYCAWIFCAFTVAEIKRYFLGNKRNSDSQFHICIDAGNGHDISLLKIGNDLKKIYGNQVLLMGGNIEHPDAYELYSNAGFDYVRVGQAGAHMSNRDKYGFYYPLGSLLNDIKEEKARPKNKTLRPVKIIADGDVYSNSDILKCIALGADYVMIGREFARVLEAEGEIMMKTGKNEETPIDKSTLPRDMDKYKIKSNCMSRYYKGCVSTDQNAGDTKFETGWEKISIRLNLQEWIDEFNECAYYAFMMTGAKNWNEYKEKIRYAITTMV